MQPNSNTPGHFESVNIAIDRYMCDVHTCMPGVVIDYNPGTQTATIQPSIKRKYADGVLQSLPQLQNVPVVFPATKTSWVRLPVTAGDEVVLHFAERSIDQWWLSGGEVDPGIPHKFNLTDAIATPGLHAQGNAIKPKGGMTSLEICNGTIFIELLPTGQIKISNGFVDLISLLNTFVTGLNSGTLTAQAAAFKLALTPFVAP